MLKNKPHKRQTFKKSEKLTGKININELFARGESFLVFPYRVSYRIIEQEQPYPVKILIGVKKKTHKRAVKRNFIKRRSREAYRLHKHDLYQWLQEKGMNLHLGMIYISPDILEYDRVEQAMDKIFNILRKKLSNV